MFFFVLENSKTFVMVFRKLLLNTFRLILWSHLVYSIFALTETSSIAPKNNYNLDPQFIFRNTYMYICA